MIYSMEDWEMIPISITKEMEKILYLMIMEQVGMIATQEMIL